MISYQLLHVCFVICSLIHAFWCTGKAMARTLDELSPSTAPHKHYIMFRYADPLTEETLKAMQADGVQRAVAFSQYPQFSCTTTGSSLNHLWRELDRLDMANSFRWSVIDRWPTHPRFIEAVCARIQSGMEKFDAQAADASKDLSDVVVVFSAHSLPMKVVNRGDQYPAEVAATVKHVMDRINASRQTQDSVKPLKYIVAWQSQVGPLPWLGPQTGEVLQGLGKQGHRRVMVVPIAFTSDHIETLYEIDIEYAHVAKEAGITEFVRAPALNDEPLLAQALAEIASEHLKSGQAAGPQYEINCPMCVNPMCRSIRNPIVPFTNMRTVAP